MSGLQLDDRVGLDGATRTAIEAVVGGHATLQQVARWAFTSDPPREIVDVVTQDEFTNDVIVRWDDTLVLVYDCT